MACSNSKCCNNNCNECSDSALTIPTNFSTDPVECPTPESCTEVFNMECICYNGPDIVELDIQAGQRLNVVLNKLIMYMTNPGCATFADDATCQGVINIITSDITTTTFNLTWNAAPAAVSYVIEYKETGAAIWTTTTPIVAPTVTAMVTGLAADTTYDVRIQTVCAASDCYSLTIRLKTNAIT